MINNREPISITMKEIFDNFDELTEKYMNGRKGFADDFQGALLGKNHIIVSNIMNSLEGKHSFGIKMNEPKSRGIIETGTLEHDCSIAQGVAGMIIQYLNNPEVEPEQQWSSCWKGNSGY